MKLIIIRHGDPIYETDSLTEKGQKEALLVADRMRKENISAVYCSPLGRARLTAKPTLDGISVKAEYVEWLQEFDYSKIDLPYLNEKHHCWDIMPDFISENPDIYLTDKWKNVDFIKCNDIAKYYDKVCADFDSMLAKHGYTRNGCCYKAERPNHDTVVLFCHFGVTAVLVSHLLSCSPYSILQNCVTLPTSVTTFFTEERNKGTAIFRCCGFGDISHLYAANEPAAFSGRFCECFTDDTRH